MFSTLLASGTTHDSHERRAVPSIALGVGVIVAMTVATQAREPLFEAVGGSRVVPLFALQPSAPQPAAPMSPPRVKLPTA